MTENTAKKKNDDQFFVAYCVTVVSLFWKSTIFWTTDAVRKIGRTAQDYKVRGFLETMIMQIYQDYLEQIIYQGEFEKGTMSKTNLDEASKVVIENIIGLEAKNENKDAVELLLAFSSFGENRLKELSRETLIQISSEENIRELVSTTLSHWLHDNQDPTLIDVYAEVDKYKACDMARTWSSIGNEKQKIQSLIFTSNNLKLMKRSLSQIVDNLNKCNFWEIEDNKDNHSYRLMYYKIVHASFVVQRRMGHESAKEKLANVYKHETSISNAEELIKIIRELCWKNDISPISTFLINFFSKNSLSCYTDKVFNKYFKELGLEEKVYLLENIILKTPYFPVAYGCLRIYFEIFQSEQRTVFLANAISNSKNTNVIGVFIFNLIDEKYIKISENERNIYRELMINTASNIKSLEQVINHLQAYAFQEDEIMSHTILDSTRVVLGNTKNISKEDYHTILTCLLVISLSSPKLQKNVFSTIHLEMGKSKTIFGLLFTDIYETFSTGVSWDYFRIGKEAGEFLKTLSPLDVIPKLNKLFIQDTCILKYREEANLRAISIYTSFAINGNIESLHILGNMESCSTIRQNSIPNALLEIHKKAKDKTFKPIVLDLVIKRFKLACSASVFCQGASKPSVFAELETIKALKRFKDIRKGFLLGISQIHLSNYPMPGFISIIEKIEEIIPESEINEAKILLRELAINLSKKINELKVVTDSKKQISSCTRIISTITKKIN